MPQGRDELYLALRFAALAAYTQVLEGAVWYCSDCAIA